jgi:enoyl-CoA hydratase
MLDRILTQRDGEIATVTLNNPEKLNALGVVMWQALAKAMQELSQDQSLRCIVIRGAGQAFASGADLSEFEEVHSTEEQIITYHEDIVAGGLKAIGECPIPVVALIHGPCIGGGLEIAAMCDLRICSESSRFGIPINRLGLALAYSEMEGLLTLVGRAVATEILLEGRILGAREAYEKGLVTRVVPNEQVEREAYDCAHRIAAGAPLIARSHKRQIKRLSENPALLTAEERHAVYSYCHTYDYQIGYRSFLDKVPPHFEGR